MVLNNLRDDAFIDSASPTGTNIVVSLDWGETNLSNKLLQVGFAMEGINANPDTDWGSVTITVNDARVDIVDTEAPTPNPMGFSVYPTDVSDN
jgi:hypothetical protein